jgi:AraC family transcriptional regulator
MDNLSIPISRAGLVRAVRDTRSDQEYGDRAKSIADALRPETPNVAAPASVPGSEHDDPLAQHGFSLKKVRTAISELCSAIRSSLDDERATAEESLRRAAEILHEMGETASLPGNEHSRGGLAPWQIRKVTNYVDAHLDQTIRNEDLATIARLNASHFGRAFRNSFGEPPHEYVNQRPTKRHRARLRTCRSGASKQAVSASRR